MKKSENTLIKLESALQRILDKKTIRIPEHRKLSVRAVEEEAGLGNGSCYYYKDFKLKINAEMIRLKAKSSNTPIQSDIEILRQKRDQERKVKNHYREQTVNLNQQLASMAAQHHQLSFALRNAHFKIEELEQKIFELQRNQIIKIK
ncbi:hypothetical protein KAM344_25410 [Aeromonas caviae]|uniref:hypothetical protein n=1 Tax=Aeromonas TaxID=642 RepID=UPI0011628C70|nr:MULTISPECIES: hypothetical protein [Aeromonas]MDM5070161.1 hypothetical protein [Aeromonas salmonicida]MDM5116266.1 hypothetical protein [Aeromonas salmonicida]QDO73947.1 hypothetical protein FCM34_00130 [Aeromonas caviae]GKQ67376.1 hypothetical protein KAM344_25410 [Aeromonas caviae]